MRKLKLAIENLAVESFETARTSDARGTVDAHGPKPGTTIQPTAITGSCCDITLALSCVQTNCLNECGLLTADACV